MKLQTSKSRMRLSKIRAENVHGIHISAPSPLTIETARKAVMEVVNAKASDATSVAALQAIVAFVQPHHTISNCDVEMK